MRVSPSGKARASQARIRGFESRHPLQNTQQASETVPAFICWTPISFHFPFFAVSFDRTESIQKMRPGQTRPSLCSTGNTCHVFFADLAILTLKTTTGIIRQMRTENRKALPPVAHDRTFTFQLPCAREKARSIPITARGREGRLRGPASSPGRRRRAGRRRR